jgi:hypothetical protein
MPRRKWPVRLPPGRRQTAPRLSWRKQEWVKDEFFPHGIFTDVTPQPGHTYTRETWPPRGRGRGESLFSPRRIAAKIRAAEVVRLRCQGYTWEQIARATGFKDASGAYRAWKRTLDRIDWDKQRREELKRKRQR